MIVPSVIKVRLGQAQTFFTATIRWIEAGANGVSKPGELKRLEITPTEVVFAVDTQTAQVQVVAVWQDGSREDVTLVAEHGQHALRDTVLAGGTNVLGKHVERPRRIERSSREVQLMWEGRARSVGPDGPDRLRSLAQQDITIWVI